MSGWATRSTPTVPEALRRARRISRRTRRRERADQPAGARGAGARRCWPLAAERSAGAHPYLTTPEHTAHARELFGNTVFLAPEHKVVLTNDADEAREIGRETVEFLSRPEQLRQQLAPAGLHRRRRRQAGQRQADRRGRRLRHARGDRRAPQRAPGRRAPTTWRSRCWADPRTSWCRALTELAGPLGLTAARADSPGPR